MAVGAKIVSPTEVLERRYSGCDFCGRTTENGCHRAVRIEFRDDRNRRLDEVRLPNEVFCSEKCVRDAAAALIGEINNPTRDDVLSGYRHLKGRIAGSNIGFSKISLVPSADE